MSIGCFGPESYNGVYNLYLLFVLIAIHAFEST
jgi:hypothetical protein